MMEPTPFFPLSWASIMTSVFMLVSYIATATALQWLWYCRRRREPKAWKLQPKRADSLQEEYALRWWLPAIASKPHPAKYARLLPTWNLLYASLCAGFVTQCIVTGRTRMVFHVEECGWRAFWGVLLLAMAQQQALEYYWHRFLHLPLPYSVIHKVHHAYKSPEPFDDLYAHPFEIFVYYCILFSPPFILPIHLYAFMIYMGLLGIAGVLDHSGIRICIPGIYDTEHHDTHHRLFTPNMGFPSPLFDILHGTFTGTFCGRRMEAAKRPRSLGPGHPFGPHRFLNLLAGAVAVLAAYGVFCNWLTRYVAP